MGTTSLPSMVHILDCRYTDLKKWSMQAIYAGLQKYSFEEIDTPPPNLTSRSWYRSHTTEIKMDNTSCKSMVQMPEFTFTYGKRETSQEV